MRNNRLKVWARGGLFKSKYFCIPTCYNNGFQCFLPQRSLWRVTKPNYVIQNYGYENFKGVCTYNIGFKMSMQRKNVENLHKKKQRKGYMRWHTASPAPCMLRPCICFWASSLKITTTSLFLKNPNTDLIVNLRHPLCSVLACMHFCACVYIYTCIMYFNEGVIHWELVIFSKLFAACSCTLPECVWQIGKYSHVNAILSLFIMTAKDASINLDD